MIDDIIEKKKIPEIAIPEEDFNNADQKEALAFSEGRLEACVQGSKRTIKAFTITAVELDALTQNNNRFSIFCGLTSGLLFFALGLFTQYIFADKSKISEMAAAATKIGVPMSIILAILFGIMTFIELRNGHNIKKALKQETNYHKI